MATSNTSSWADDADGDDLGALPPSTVYQPPEPKNFDNREPQENLNKEEESTNWRRGGSSANNEEKSYEQKRSYNDNRGDNNYGGGNDGGYRREKRVYDNKPVEVDPERYPKEAPFTAYIGNLSYDISKEVVEEFFGDLKVVRISLPIDRESERSKGHGYVEFESLDDLKAAVGMGGKLVLERNIRIDVTEKRINNRDYGNRREGGYNNRRRYGDRDGGDRDDYSKDRFGRSSEADEVGSWRKKKKVQKKPNYDSWKDNDDDKGNKYGRSSRFGGGGSRGGWGSSRRDDDRRDNRRDNDKVERPKREKKQKENPFGDSKPWEPNEYAKKIWERNENRQKDVKQEESRDKDIWGKKSRYGDRDRDDYSKNRYGGNRRQGFGNRNQDREDDKPQKKPVKPQPKKKTTSNNSFGLLQDMQ